MVSVRFTLFTAAALSCAALVNASCLVDPDSNGVVTADQITQVLAAWSDPYEPGGLTHLPEMAFSGCTDLQTVTLPDSLETMGDSAFSGCTGLQTVTLPDSLKTMGTLTFFGCTGLQTVTLPDSLETMGDSTFFGCTDLQTVTLPDSLETMGDYNFFGCTGLQAVCGAKRTYSQAREMRWRWTDSIGISEAMMTTACPAPASVDSGACSAKCCKGTWSGTNNAVCTRVDDGLILVKHDTTSGHTHHRCYGNDDGGCICECEN
jgi:hypothetical protein